MTNVAELLFPEILGKSCFLYFLIFGASERVISFLFLINFHIIKLHLFAAIFNFTSK